jgi:hypothetical protein
LPEAAAWLQQNDYNKNDFRVYAALEVVCLA